VDLSDATVSEADLREANLSQVDLSGANLVQTNLRKTNLRGAKLSRANLNWADLGKADFRGADLREANLSRANLSEANLSGANLSEANFSGVNLSEANLSEANLNKANLGQANLSWANLSWANLSQADLRGDLSGVNLVHANLSQADLSGANLSGANLIQADLGGANLSGANLSGAPLVAADLTDAVLKGSSIYGISAWDVKVGKGTKQQDLVITREGEPEVTVDNIEVAQFVYLLLHNEKIRDVIDTVGRKGVLLLGRFTAGRIAILERLREELRERGYVPIVFNFDKPETKDFTETVRILGGLSHFVIADVTNPKSAPLELQATVPEIMVPFQPIIEQGEKPFAMLQDLWIKHRDWVLEPIEYSSVDRLVETMDAEIIGPIEARSDELVMRRAETLRVRRV
jgi:uncharacterized protein YjbI with pentapeptide repeats